MKKNASLFFALFIYLLSASSCQTNPPSSSDATAAAPYFSLQQYFTQINQQAISQRTRLRKTVALDGQTETKQLQPDSLAWLNEWALFLNSDINRSAWRDSYATDSSYLPNQQQSLLQYRSRDEQLRTQHIQIWKQRTNHQIDSIAIWNRVKNVFYTLDEKLYFTPQKGYRIYSIQSTRLTKADTMQIIGVFE